MKRFVRGFTVALMCASLFASHVAEAKRIGGGRSTGMQRNNIQRQAAPPPQRDMQPAPAPAPVQQPARSNGLGMAGGILGGLAAGSLLGYMFGHNASGAAQGDTGVPWGMLLLLGALTVGGVLWLRRRQNVPAQARAAYAGSYAPATQPVAQPDRVFRIGEGAVGAASTSTASAVTGGRLPDGTETAAFLRQARGSFMHMQTLNSPEQVEEMRRYMTPELFAELQSEMMANTEAAEFTNLDGALLEVVNDGGRLVASVRFTGMVSESLHAAPVPFAEIWHFVKPQQGDPRWLLAGIQQD